MNKPTFLVGALSVLALTVTTSLAQTALVVPSAPAAATGSGGNTFPWGRTTAQIRFQQQYAVSNFSTLTSPIIIQRLRFRSSDSNATTTTWTGGTYNGARISMSTAANPHTSMSTTFASNHGADLKQVFPQSGGTNLGAITLAPGTGTGTGVPGPWYVDVTLATPFLYDPGSGKDLLVDIQLDGSWTGGTATSATIYSGTAASAQGTRVYNTTDWQGTTSTGTTVEYTLATEFTYVPAQGLFASFSATPVFGGPNLKVQFTDTSFTSATGGITSWAWDFDGDKKVDSTLQNPAFTYTCGLFSPSLTVTDGVNPPSTRLETNLISAGVVAVDFDVTGSLIGAAPLKLTFNDKSTGGPVAWAWDFDGDNQVDSTLQNPTHTYTTPGTYDVTLSITGVCNKDSTTKKGLVTVCGPNSNQGSITTLMTGGNGLTANGCGNLFDVLVKNTNGLKVTSIDISTRAAATTNVSIDVYVTPKAWNGPHGDMTQWVKVASGTAASLSPSAGTFTPVDVNDFYLPPGSYGMYIIFLNGGMHYTNQSTTNNFYSNCDLDLSLGAAQNVPFSGSLTNSRVWNGTLHYAANDQAGSGGYGFGCPGSNSATPFLSLSADPVVGTSVNLDILDMVNVTSGGGLLLIGSQTQQVDLAGIGMPKCALFTNVLASLGFANTAGKASIPGKIPNNSSLIGAQIFAQAANDDPGANTLGVAATNPVAMRLGK